MSSSFSLLTTFTVLPHEAQAKRWITRRKQKKIQNYSIWSYSPHPTELLHLPVVWSALSQKSPKESIRAACHRKHTAHMSKHRRVMWGLRRREQCCCLCKSCTRPPHVNKASKEFQKGKHALIHLMWDAGIFHWSYVYRSISYLVGENWAQTVQNVL